MVASPKENRAASVFISDSTTRLQMPNLPPFSCLYTAVSTANVHANNVALITGASSRLRRHLRASDQAPSCHSDCGHARHIDKQSMPLLVCKLPCKNVIRSFTVTFVAGDIVGAPALYMAITIVQSRACPCVNDIHVLSCSGAIIAQVLSCHLILRTMSLNNLCFTGSTVCIVEAAALFHQKRQHDFRKWVLLLYS